ncbi:MAG TPA: ATP-binding protein [Nitrospirota bacterium]|nr:ATP-binding protein [Nitrospirota bacterium]
MKSIKYMSLKKKIALSFVISAFIIALLAAFEYINFIEIRKEIRYLEITDTLSRKSLQLRRHEKNFFLSGPRGNAGEAVMVRDYIGQIKGILAQNPHIDEADQLSLRAAIHAYEERFDKIDAAAATLTTAFERVKAEDKRSAAYLDIVEAAFLERPAQSAGFLTTVFRLPPRHGLVIGLRGLDADITALRKTGEDILVISKDLDKVAREKAETVIRVSQLAILIFFPLFFAVGIGMLFFITANVVRRLMLLITVVEKTGKGSYPHLTVAPSDGNARDEVGVLIEKFNDMEDQLALREQELERKSRELMQAKKLAAIGTLASGVAHELNNPLNNIYLSAQALTRDAGESCSPEVKEAVGDIVGQTERVKRIVSDLLEFARGREPQYQDVDLCGLITDAYRHAASSRDLSGIRYVCSSDPLRITASLDQGQMEQVFTNLFMNAADAMRAKGEITVTAKREAQDVVIRVSDSGRGIPRESQDKIFEPFFTTKDKGTGLGLAIVYNIIKKHDGDITVQSEEGKGTTFVITLPVGKIS